MSAEQVPEGTEVGDAQAAAAYGLLQVLRGAHDIGLVRLFLRQQLVLLELQRRPDQPVLDDLVRMMRALDAFAFTAQAEVSGAR